MGKIYSAHYNNYNIFIPIFEAFCDESNLACTYNYTEPTHHSSIVCSYRAGKHFENTCGELHRLRDQLHRPTERPAKQTDRVLTVFHAQQ